jgi:UDP-N-acetylglucosamine pyrophosphorylase
MSRPYYRSNAKNDPCGPKLEQFYHTAYNDMEILDQNKKEALNQYKELSRECGEEDLRPDEFLTQIHQFTHAFKEALNENTRKREEEKRIRARREAFLAQNLERDKMIEARKLSRQQSADGAKAHAQFVQ